MTSLTSVVLSVNLTAVVHEGEWTGSVGRTGIDKRPVSGLVNASNECLLGDVVADRKNHGGYDQAVYAYASEDVAWWEKEIGMDIAYGRFGENLTTKGVDVTNAVIGQRWSIGTTILEVSQPRIPCRVFEGFWGRPGLIKDFTRAGRPGAYLRIVQEGELQAGDEISIVRQPTHGVTIADLFAAKAGERSRVAEIARNSDVSEDIRQWANRILETTKEF
ncbi:MAG TPA: MOSC domain-containing protein [Candidatus Nanopelagicaceae bacterium]